MGFQAILATPRLIRVCRHSGIDGRVRGRLRLRLVQSDDSFTMIARGYWTGEECGKWVSTLVGLMCRRYSGLILTAMERACEDPGEDEDAT